MPTDELLQLTPHALVGPAEPRAVIQARMVCPGCGEEVLYGRQVRVGSRELCRGCAAEAADVG
jgi:formylmethanofuran dehydrogenase subunit E